MLQYRVSQFFNLTVSTTLMIAPLNHVNFGPKHCWKLNVYKTDSNCHMRWFTKWFKTIAEILRIWSQHIVKVLWMVVKYREHCIHLDMNYFQMISAEAPVLFSKAAEIFVSELSLRAWIHTEENKRRTLQVRHKTWPGTSTVYYFTLYSMYSTPSCFKTTLTII